MKNEINSLQSKKKLLLHVCCAPCSSACLERLHPFEITMFYYNPNTYPQSEYDLRFAQFKKLTDLPIINAPYRHDEFLLVAKDFAQEKEGGDRCKKCIELRLRKTFEYAKTNGFDYVTTTLSISPHKDADFINKIGKELEKEFNINFLVADFKKENGFLNSIKLSKQFDLYRQDYCGCEFSKTNK